MKKLIAMLVSAVMVIVMVSGCAAMATEDELTTLQGKLDAFKANVTTYSDVYGQYVTATGDNTQDEAVQTALAGFETFAKDITEVIESKPNKATYDANVKSMDDQAAALQSAIDNYNAAIANAQGAPVEEAPAEEAPAEEAVADEEVALDEAPVEEIAE